MLKYLIQLVLFNSPNCWK